jgi:multidrug efflux system membrane fusion protein
VDSNIKTLIRVGVSALLLLGGGLGFRAYTSHTAAAKVTATKDAAAASDRPVSVLTVPVVQRDMPLYLEGIGNVVAYATVTVKAQVDGRIDKIGFVEGQQVHKGDLIAQIDPRPFQAQLNSAQAALARDSATLGGALKNLDRYHELAKQGLSSQQQVDDQVALVAQLRGTVAADSASIDSARLNLDYAHITSPIDGVTGIRLVDQGNLVHSSDAGGIVVLTTLDPIAVIFTLPQDNLSVIAEEQAKGGISVQAMSRDGGTKLADGTLAVIDNQILTATATIRLKALFPNPNHALWPNQFVKTRLLISTRKNALVIPAAVVQHGPTGDFAYAVGPDMAAVVKPVKVDVMQGDQVVIASGLSAGDQVVLDGQSNLKPGSKCAPRTAPGANAPAAPGSAGADSAGAKDSKPPTEAKKEKAPAAGAGR